MKEREKRVKDLWSIFDREYEETSLKRGAFRAPGRVNLIGDHTDYNDGFVLPVAIDREIIMLGQLRSDDKVQVYALDLHEKASLSLTEEHRAVKEKPWLNYLLGVVVELLKLHLPLKGMDLLFTGTIPQGAGLSSSAALEVATALAITELHSIEMDPVEMALLCQRAENNFVGVLCGIMDQYISRLGREGNALLIDCRNHDYQLIPLSLGGYELVMVDSKVERGLVDSQYNKRFQECMEAVEYFDSFLDHEILALRDVGVEGLEENIHRLPASIGRRARHVITENARVEESIRAFKKGDLHTFGSLMVESHKSLRDDFQVSCSALDLLVDLALEEKGVLGARMTGAGFGGCTVNLVKEDQVEDFSRTIIQEYFKKTERRASVYCSRTAHGASPLPF